MELVLLSTFCFPALYNVVALFPGPPFFHIINSRMTFGPQRNTEGGPGISHVINVKSHQGGHHFMLALRRVGIVVH